MCNVTAMQTRTCAGCGDLIPYDAPAEQAQIYERRRLRRDILCADCAEYPTHARKFRERTIFIYLGDMDEPVNCVTCGLPVILPTDKRRRVAACSDRCRSRYYAAMTRVSVPETPCAECGNPSGGRADRAYCSNACRQKAYRRRVAALGRGSSEWGKSA